MNNVVRRFSALQRAENSSISGCASIGWSTSNVSVLFSEPKIPQSAKTFGSAPRAGVSVLFSEPKIPQSAALAVLQRKRYVFQCSSASRKFLNQFDGSDAGMSRPFQCSSASRKFLNRAEVDQRRCTGAFQCSSASRKFLNTSLTSQHARPAGVSVLFSEPKIPQSDPVAALAAQIGRFSALQRAENSSILERYYAADAAEFPFQCSSASRKFLNRHHQDLVIYYFCTI